MPDLPDKKDIWPRWPSLSYLRDAAAVYVALAVVAAVLFVVGVVVLARPFWVLVFLAGVTAGVSAYRWQRVVRSWLARLRGVLPGHA